jgi:Tfp pilus assembly protein PilN
LPTSIGQFVHNEVKHFVALSGKRIALDFCGIGSGGKSGSDRLIVVAADNRNVAQIVKACNLACVNVEVIEPPLLAYARAFYAKKIAGKFDCNVLIAIVQGGTLTLCVFKRQALDFVRTRDIDQEQAEPGELCQRLAEEINAIIQFYDSAEGTGSLGKWEITVVADSVQLPEDVEQSLKTKLTVDNLQVRRPEEAFQDTSVVGDGARADTGASAVAIGLAMKLLASDESNLRVNLLPPEATDVKMLKRHALITANILAAVLFGMVMATAGAGLMVRNMNTDIARQKKGEPLSDLNALIEEERLLDRRIKQLSNEPGLLNEVLGSGGDVDWAVLLNDIRKGTPAIVCVTSLFSKGDSAIYLEGVGLSYEAVRLFVNMLGKSEYIKSASLIETEKDDEMGGLIRYAINCFSNPKEGR